MSDFKAEEITRVDVKRPSKVPPKAADLCPVPAAEGGAGKVTYTGSLAAGTAKESNE